MEELIYKLNGVRMLDVVEEEMIQLWLRNDTIPYLLKEAVNPSWDATHAMLAL